MTPFHLNDIDQLVLEGLYAEGAVRLHELADTIGVPPYLVRGSLKKLTPTRLIEDRISSRGREWKLTAHGLSHAKREPESALVDHGAAAVPPANPLATTPIARRKDTAIPIRKELHDVG